MYFVLYSLVTSKACLIDKISLEIIIGMQFNQCRKKDLFHTENPDLDECQV